jgi:hypothetical protein
MFQLELHHHVCYESFLTAVFRIPFPCTRLQHAGVLARLFCSIDLSVKVVPYSDHPEELCVCLSSIIKQPPQLFLLRRPVQHSSFKRRTNNWLISDIAFCKNNAAIKAFIIFLPILSSWKCISWLVYRPKNMQTKSAMFTPKAVSSGFYGWSTLSDAIFRHLTTAYPLGNKYVE